MSEPKQQPKPKQLNFHCDPGLLAEIKARSMADQTSLRAVVMRALKGFGFNVPPADLEDKRKQ